jgi:hypothetical protein
MRGNGRRPKLIYLYPRDWCSGGLVFPKREYAIGKGPHVFFAVVSYPPPSNHSIFRASSGLFSV